MSDPSGILTNDELENLKRTLIERRNNARPVAGLATVGNPERAFNDLPEDEQVAEMGKSAPKYPEEEIFDFIKAARVYAEVRSRDNNDDNSGVWTQEEADTLINLMDWLYNQEQNDEVRALTQDISDYWYAWYDMLDPITDESKSAEIVDGLATLAQVRERGYIVNAEQFESLSGLINACTERPDADLISEQDEAQNYWDRWVIERMPTVAEALGLTKPNDDFDKDEYNLVEQRGGQAGHSKIAEGLAKGQAFKGPFQDRWLANHKKTLDRTLRSIAAGTHPTVSKENKFMTPAQPHGSIDLAHHTDLSPAITTPAGVAPAENSKNAYADNPNPKDALGIQKVSLGYIPGPTVIYTALGFQNGGVKYGPYNWRAKKVLKSVYVDAAERHLNLIKDGEWIDPSSKIPHAAHLLASIGILVDAYEEGCLIDDMPKDGPTSHCLAHWNGQLKDTLIPMWVAEREARKIK